MTRPIRWLHLSDLHYGCPGKELWEQVEGEFLTDLDQWCERLGPPDLLLFTGDLAYSGQEKEYEQVDAFLDDVLGHLRRSGAPEPILVAVPGNHDITRPEKGSEARSYHILRALDGTTESADVSDLYEELWKDQDASFIHKLLPAYSTWFEQRIRPQLAAKAKHAHFSHFPNDFTAVVEPDGSFPLTLVGLNSTWLQYTGGDFDGKLLIPLEQFRAALVPQNERKPYKTIEGDNQALLLQHHPPDWLSLRARDLFDESIYQPSYFSACLFGHLHSANGTDHKGLGGKGRTYLQSPSLCGLERWGSGQEKRAFGYSWGQIAEDGEIRIWPRSYDKRVFGNRSFGPDPQFDEDPDHQGLLLRPGTAAAPGTVSQRSSPDLRSYLARLIERTETLEIRGIAGEENQTAIAPPIENLYTPLRVRGGSMLEPPSRDPSGPSPEQAIRSSGAQALQVVLRHHRRVLIQGEPGAGKTTFLQLIACMLARDADRRPGPKGATWSKYHLGLEFDCPPVPILLRLAGLIPVLGDDDGADDRSRLLDLLRADWQDRKMPSTFGTRSWKKLLEEGRAWLLLDGLDEVADQKLRQRLFSIVRDAAEHWKCPMILASRPFQTEPVRKLGFEVATVEPFDDDQIEEFLAYWTAAIHRQDPRRAREGRSGRYLERLRQAIFTRPKVRAIARNPVMLTCLCVVHWNNNDLPEVRSRVYKGVLHWLLKARERLREENLELNPDQAERALSAIALQAMETALGKQSVLELDFAAQGARPVLARQFPALDGERLDQQIRRWLLFECEGSGVIEELAGHRLRFWHLTFQEYLAALELARSEMDVWWPKLESRFDQAQWWETTELFATCLYDLKKQEAVDQLLERILGAGGKTPELAEEARRVGILGRLLPPLETCGYRPAPELHKSYEGALTRSLEIFTREGAARVPVENRRAAAEALGRGGDPRLHPNEDNFRAVPGTSIELGIYPVTVQEYRRFVEDRDYDKRALWGDAWEVRKEQGWETPGSWEEQLETPNRPVTEVSWWEATAYCRWLSNQSRCTIRLPTEEEWQAAATHPGGGEYPWGAADPTPELANFDQSAGGHPTPVGIYPAGAGAHGHLDLAGNVWEWCSDELDNDLRPLRGGAWWVVAGFLRSAVRRRVEPDRRYDGFGFRVCCPSPSTVSGNLDS
ncbi:MAG: SUMF1/EgtB/PvdO family nonheme iron enzyme [Acidobacteriota bacterium]|nr:SUMF1/EgtB/PvdO family nonheme iron enzyme [Acidobacteriota bacterium]